MDNILQVFQDFAAISGLRISLEKSTLFLAGIAGQSREEILRQFPFESGVLPVRYLGLPLLTKRMSLSDCLPLLEKIRARISSWKNRFLSFAGRLQLLSSVISSLTNFWMSAFRLPSSCIKEINKICSAFLWSGPDLNTRKAKVAWNDVCRPKNEGGLGLKSIEEANKVSCFKLIWRIVSASSLWVDWIKRELLRHESFWSIRENANSGSWIWRKLLKYRQQAKDFCQMKVRSGLQTSFWFDSWCSLGPLHSLLGNRGFIDLGISSTATVAEAIRHRRRRHRVDLLNQIEVELDRYRTAEIGLDKDYALWRGLGDKFRPKFSAKETWSQVRIPGQVQPWSKGIWFSNSTPKYSFLLWLATLNRLSTGDRMFAWKGGGSPSCVFCNDIWETRDHLFFSCPYSSSVWEKLTARLLEARYTTSFVTILSLTSGNTLPPTPRFILRYVFQASAHALWRERNGRRHGEAPKTPAQLVKLLDQVVRNRLYSLTTPASLRLEDGLRTWFAARG